MSELTGKGKFIWQIRSCEGGNVERIATLAEAAGFSHILLKICDGVWPYNVHQGVDLVGPLAEALHARGIAVWGWHYVYGDDPIGEASVAIESLSWLHLDGYVIDAEGEYKRPGKAAAARKFMSRLRAALPSLPVALSSYRYPSLHPQLPWREFLESCDFNMPQVYWIGATNSAAQLRRCIQEFSVLQPQKPILPTGAAFKQGVWYARPAEATAFLEEAQALGLPGANFWEWANTRRYLPDVWQAVVKFSWGAATTPGDPPPPPPPTTYRLRANVWALNIREQPWRSGPAPAVLRTIAKGEVVRPVGERDGAWSRLADEPGWVNTTYLEPVEG